MELTITFQPTGRDEYIRRILQKKAALAGLTIEEWILNWINTWAEDQFVAYYLDKVRNMSFVEMINTLGDLT